jgi:hypothetical protein
MSSVYVPANYAPPYGIGDYGPPRVYGTQLWSQYSINFTAAPQNYTNVLLTWDEPVATNITGYRLLSNRYGFPVDQNDGNILLNTSSYFGSQYVDQNIIPGRMIYYAIYLYAGSSWIRGGFTACLVPYDYQSGAYLFGNLPAYFQQLQDSDLTLGTGSNVVLQAFLNVIGWGFDYLQTQYNFIYENLNAPQYMPLSDLYNLSEELGLTFLPEVPGSQMRVAVENWTEVCKERGTPLGITDHIELLTDYGVDLRTSSNIMLEMDQSNFLDPVQQAWSPYTAYKLGEMVTYGQYIYHALSATYNLGSTGFTTATGSLTVSATSNQSDAIVVAVMSAAPISEVTLTDSAGNTYESIGSTNPLDGGTITQQFYVAYGTSSLASGVGTITLAAGTAQQYLMSAYGVPGAGSIDLAQTSPSTNSTAPTLTTTTTNHNDEMRLAFFTNANSVTLTSGTPSGWTSVGTASTSTYRTQLFSEQQFYKGSFTISGTYAAAQNWAVTVLTFQRSAVGANLGQAPTGTTSSNTYWAVVEDYNDPFLTLANSVTAGGVNTWEAIYPSQALTYVAPTGSLINGLGVENPLNTSNFQSNDIRVTNLYTSGAQQMWARTLSRLPSDVTAGNANWAPDWSQPIYDGIPVPATNQTSAWVDNIRYATNSIVTFNSLPYQAQRASTGAQPPSVGTPLNENYAFTSLTGWATTGGTLSQSSSNVFVGTNSGELTPSGSAATPTVTSQSVPVIANAGYMADAWLVIPTGGPNTVTISINWTGLNGIAISTSTATVSVTSTYTKLQLASLATAPANATNATVSVAMSGTPLATEVMYIGFLRLACWTTPEWVPLSKDRRIRLMISAYCSQSLTQVTDYATNTTPFVEWYDQNGHYLNRLFARTATVGTAAPPANLTFDSFTTQPNAYLNGRETDTDDQTWTQPVGYFQIGQYNGGSAYQNNGVRSIALITSTDVATIAVTLLTPAASGYGSGIVFRYASSTSYLVAGWSKLWSYSSGTYTALGTYSTAAQAGDRLTVELAESSPYITVLVNGVSVLTSTSATNDTATQHGLIVDAGIS